MPKGLCIKESSCSVREDAIGSKSIKGVPYGMPFLLLKKNGAGVPCVAGPEKGQDSQIFTGVILEKLIYL